MAHEGEFSRPLSDAEQDVLRALVPAPAPLPQDRMRIGDLAEASARRRLFDRRDGVDLQMAAALLSRTWETAAASHNPERKLS